MTGGFKEQCVISGSSSSLGAGCVKGCYFPSSLLDSYRREHSSRLPFKAQFGSVDIHVGQEDAQAHFGSFQSSTKLILFWGVVVEAMAHIK